MPTAAELRLNAGEVVRMKRQLVEVIEEGIYNRGFAEGDGPRVEVLKANGRSTRVRFLDDAEPALIGRSNTIPENYSHKKGEILEVHMGYVGFYR